jgi:hypothetical protein
MTIGASAMRMGAAKEAGTLTDAHGDAVRAGLIAGFSEMLENSDVRVPAQVHLVRAIA